MNQWNQWQKKSTSRAAEPRESTTKNLRLCTCMHGPLAITVTKIIFIESYCQNILSSCELQNVWSCEHNHYFSTIVFSSKYKTHILTPPKTCHFHFISLVSTSLSVFFFSVIAQADLEKLMAIWCMLWTFAPSQLWNLTLWTYAPSQLWNLTLWTFAQYFWPCQLQASECAFSVIDKASPFS